MNITPGFYRLQSAVVRNCPESINLRWFRGWLKYPEPWGIVSPEKLLVTLLAWIPSHKSPVGLIAEIHEAGRCEEIQSILLSACLAESSELQSEFRQRARRLARMLNSPALRRQLASVA